jgi:hypothetical protein
VIQDKTLDAAILEARRFINAAETLRLDRRNNPDRRDWQPNVHASACHRASMDLTRKLADLRQGR